MDEEEKTTTWAWAFSSNYSSSNISIPLPPTTFRHEDDELTTATILLAGILLSVLIFVSISGNILVCVAIYTDRGLRRIGNLFLGSLAIADLLVASLVMTFAVVNDLLGYWVFGPTVCDTWIALDVMCSTASILNLCAISMDRYIHIKDPLRYGRYVTKRVAVVSIACVWLLAVLISFLPISLGLHRPAEEPPTVVVNAEGAEFPTCALDLAPTYAIVSSCISFYIPTLVMLGIYLRLYRYAQKHVQSIKAVTTPFANSSQYSPDQPHAIAARLHHVQQTSSSYHVSDHKAAITVGIIMGVFLICWVPFFCVNIVAAFCKTCIPGVTFKILTWLGYSNSAFNPVIYSIFNKDFREAFKRILTAKHGPCCDDDYNYSNTSRSEIYRPRRSNDDYFGGNNYYETASTRPHNGSCSQIKESSSGISVKLSAVPITPDMVSSGSMRQVRISSTEKDLTTEIIQASEI